MAALGMVPAAEGGNAVEAAIFLLDLYKPLATAACTERLTEKAGNIFPILSY